MQYSDVVSIGERFTELVGFTGGSDARFETSFPVVSNRNRNYPIEDVSDDILVVVYRNVSKPWIDTIVMPQ